MQIFTESLSNWAPTAFLLLVAVFGALRLSWEINHRFILLTRTREDVRRRLLRGLGRNALVVAMVMGGMVVVAALWAFWVVPTWGMVQFQPEQLVGRDEAGVREWSLNLFTFAPLATHGTWLMTAAYASFVAVTGVVWASLSYLLVLVVPNRYVALSAPFVGGHLVDFVIQVLGYPQFSPIVSVYPFNVVAPSWWTPLVPLAAVMAMTAALGGYCWRRADALESLA